MNFRRAASLLALVLAVRETAGGPRWLLRFAAAATSASGSASDPAAGTAEPQLLLQGRFVPGNDEIPEVLPQLMTWPGSSITVAFANATAVSVVIDGSLDSIPEGSRAMSFRVGWPSNYFLFELDGKEVGRELSSEEQPVLTWSQQGLSPGPHTLTITKLSATNYGAAWLQSIDLQPPFPTARFLPPPPSPGRRSGRRMLFIGDSISTGVGALADSNCEKLSAENSDATQAFTALTAAHFGADYQLLAWGGSGMSVYPRKSELDWPEEQQTGAAPNMRDLFYRTNPLDPASNYSAWNNWVPQVVVLAAGLNDIFNSTLDAQGRVEQGEFGMPPLQQWLDDYEALVLGIRTAYPAAAIVAVTFPLPLPLSGLRTLEQAAVYLQTMAAAASRLQAARIPNTYSLQMTDGDIDNSDWCVNHPDAAAQRELAQQLIQFIAAAIPEFAGTTPSQQPASAAGPSPAA